MEQLLRIEGVDFAARMIPGRRGRRVQVLCLACRTVVSVSPFALRTPAEGNRVLKLVYGHFEASHCRDHLRHSAVATFAAGA